MQCFNSIRPKRVVLVSCKSSFEEEIGQKNIIQKRIIRIIMQLMLNDVNWLYSIKIYSKNINLSMKSSTKSRNSQLIQLFQLAKGIRLQNTQQYLMQCINTLRKKKNDLLEQFNSTLDKKNEEQLNLKQVKKKMAKYDQNEEQEQSDDDILKYTTATLQQSQSVIAVNLALRQKLQELQQAQKIKYDNKTPEEIQRQIIHLQQQSFTLEQELTVLDSSEKELEKNLEIHAKQKAELQEQIQELFHGISMRQTYEIRKQEQLLYQIQQYRKKNGTILEQLLSYQQ